MEETDRAGASQPPNLIRWPEFNAQLISLYEWTSFSLSRGPKARSARSHSGFWISDSNDAFGARSFPFVSSISQFLPRAIVCDICRDVSDIFRYRSRCVRKLDEADDNNQRCLFLIVAVIILCKRIRRRKYLSIDLYSVNAPILWIPQEALL